MVLKQSRAIASSVGHRILHPEAVSIPSCSAYVECLRSAYVEVEPKAPRENNSEIEASASKI